MHRWVDHTAELELAIEADSEREVFAAALAALAELWDVPGGAVRDVPGGPVRERREIAVGAPDRAALLAAWMEELVFLAESEGFVGTELEQIELSPTGMEANLKAKVSGTIGTPRPIVKAVTYHDLMLEPGAEGYVAKVVLDV